MIYFSPYKLSLKHLEFSLDFEIRATNAHQRGLVLHDPKLVNVPHLDDDEYDLWLHELHELLGCAIIIAVVMHPFNREWCLGSLRLSIAFP